MPSKQIGAIWLLTLAHGVNKMIWVIASLNQSGAANPAGGGVTGGGLSCFEVPFLPLLHWIRGLEDSDREGGLLQGELSQNLGRGKHDTPFLMQIPCL